MRKMLWGLANLGIVVLGGFALLGFLSVLYSCASTAKPISIKSLGTLDRMEISSDIFSVWYTADTPEKAYDMAMYWAADAGIIHLDYLAFTVMSENTFDTPSQHACHLVVKMLTQNQPDSFNCEIIATRICYKYNIDLDSPIK